MIITYHYQYMESHKIHVPNHQSSKTYLLHPKNIQNSQRIQRAPGGWDLLGHFLDLGGRIKAQGAHHLRQAPAQTSRPAWGGHVRWRSELRYVEVMFWDQCF